MHRKVDFFRTASTYRVHFGDLRSEAERGRLLIYINNSCRLAKAFQLDDFPVQPISVTDGLQAEELLKRRWLELEDYMGGIHAEFIFELDVSLKEKYATIDANWREAATRHLSVIREIVRRSDVKDNLRQSIMSRIEHLQREIDRNKVRLESFGDAVMYVSGLVQRSEKKLAPVLDRLERLAGALYNAKAENMEQSENQPRLPPPEMLGLPEPDAEEDSTS